MLSARTRSPIDKVNGKPTAKMFNCGATRVRIPSARLVINNAVNTGSDNCKPDLKISLPHCASVENVALVVASVPTGKVLKLCEISAIIIK